MCQTLLIFTFLFSLLPSCAIDALRLSYVIIQTVLCYTSLLYLTRAMFCYSVLTILYICLLQAYFGLITMFCNTLVYQINEDDRYLVLRMLYCAMPCYSEIFFALLYQVVPCNVMRCYSMVYRPFPSMPTCTKMYYTYNAL